jgi:hypothetical protein
LFAADAVFSSPVADYEGRERACHLLGLIAGVVKEVEPTAEWSEGGATVSAFVARVDGLRLEGMLCEERDASGALVHVTLFLRPFKTLRVAIGRMGELLEANPLPEAS